MSLCLPKQGSVTVTYGSIMNNVQLKNPNQEVIISPCFVFSALGGIVIWTVFIFTLPIGVQTSDYWFVFHLRLIDLVFQKFSFVMQNTSDSRADEMLKDLASDYANYLITDTPTEVNNEIMIIWWKRCIFYLYWLILHYLMCFIFSVEQAGISDS